MLDSSTLDTALLHAWRYFELHANQRIKVFNFFLALTGLVSAGLAVSIQGGPRLGLLGGFLGVLLMMVSFIFWKLDQRVSFLIKHAESALSKIENALSDDRAKLFLNEPSRTDVVLSSGNLWSRQWTYGKCFRSVFIVMALVGFVNSVWSALQFFEDSSLTTQGASSSLARPPINSSSEDGHIVR